MPDSVKKQLCQPLANARGSDWGFTAVHFYVARTIWCGRG